jgi:hypothetical protein
MSVWRLLIPILLGVAGIGAIVVSADASTVGRAGGVLAAVALGGVGVGVVRGQSWAHGAAFFLGLFWLWATLALRIQGVMSGPEVLGWLAWSVVVMAGSVRARSA